MTKIEFQDLARLARVRESPSLRAARFVLLAGMRPGDAAKEAGTSPQALNNILRKIKDATGASAS